MKQTPVYFQNALNQLYGLTDKIKPNLMVLIMDKNTHRHCLPLFLSEFETDIPVELIEIPAGEANKELKVAVQTWKSLLACGVNKNSLIIHLGGGMVTDFGGFVSAVYMRGIPYINIPTSLLAMVDAAVGGKTGLDMNGVKNLLGLYSFPIATLIHTPFLKTLPEREFRSGMAEMLKHGLIYGRKHWKKIIQLKNPSPENISELIKESVQLKLDIVEKDPYEKGLRKILNFGHTIGHAVESEYLNSENPLLHGEAIAIGIQIEAVLSAEIGLMNKSELDEILSNMIALFGKNKIEESSIENLMQWMEHDKKNTGDKINFSLLNGLGVARFNVELNKEQIIEGIKIYNRMLEMI